MRFPPVHERSVLITGCSSGIGAATALLLRARGWKVLASARKPADVEALTRKGFDAVELDVASSESVQRAADEVLSRLDGRIGAIVNNAGFALAGAVEDLTREGLRRQFEVNVFGLQELTNRFIPEFRKQGAGRIVNVSSVLGLITTPMVGSYCASKFALESLSDALRIELRSSGIAVSLVEPGPIITQFRHNLAKVAEEILNPQASRFGKYYEKEIARRSKRKEKKPDLFNKPPEAVAKKILHALESTRPKRRYLVTIPAYLGAFLRRVAPTAFLDAVLVKRLPE